MKIYTKTGDGGTTRLFNGLKVQKSNKIIEALGAIDELNAWMGTIKSSELLQIQRELMQISSFIAGFKIKIPDPVRLEKEIDRMQKILPKLQNFILPSGQIHVARAVCRRAERRVIGSGIRRNDTLKYLNRLSDYLFVLARWENFKNKKKEKIWVTTN